MFGLILNTTGFSVMMIYFEQFFVSCMKKYIQSFCNVNKNDISTVSFAFLWILESYFIWFNENL